MIASPFLLTNVAKLIATAAGHVLATLIFFNNERTFDASLVLKIGFQESHSILLALTSVHPHQAFGTVLDPTNNAGNRLLIDHNVPFATLFGTQSLIWVATDPVEDEYLVVSCFLCTGELVVECTVLLENLRTVGLGALGFLIAFDSITDVLPDAVFAEGVPTLWTKLNKIFFIDMNKAYWAFLLFPFVHFFFYFFIFLSNFAKTFLFLNFLNISFFTSFFFPF